MAIEFDPGCLDPAIPSYVPGVNRAVFDSLTELDPATGSTVPWLAESWEINGDASVYTFHLKEGVTFSDGTPFDAEAVKANFDHVKEAGPRLGGAYNLMTTYESTKVLDPNTVQVTFTGPNAGFLQASSSLNLAVVSPSTLDLDEKDRCQGKLVGSGPFVLHSYEADQQVALERRDDYAWGSEMRENRGEAYLDRIEFTVVGESSVRSGGLQSGQFDVIEASPQDEVLLEKSSTARLTHQPQGGLTTTLHLNHRSPLLAEEAVRKAMSLGIDREEIVSTTLSPRYRPATAPLTAAQPGHVDLSAKLARDADRAKKVLDAAGWKEGPDGIRTRGGTRLSIEVMLIGGAPAIELAKQQLAEIGMELMIKVLPVATYQQREQAGDFDVSFSSRGRPDGDILRELYSTRALNRYDLQPSSLDGLLEAQAAEPDQTARESILAEAQEYIVDHGVSVPLYDGIQVHACSNQVKAMRYDLSGTQLFAEVWLSQ